MSKSKLAIYFSTCDGYSDCWDPFFTLFEKYWPDFDGTIYLTSEYKDYNRQRVVSMRLCEAHAVPKEKRISWSKLTRWALEAIPSDIILFMQEDFFLKAPVKSDIIDEYFALMIAHPEIKCLHLTDQCGKGSHPSEFKNLDEMDLRRPYRISCQSALWRKQELLTLLRDRESAWEWEMFGSTRSSALGHLYLQVSRDYVRLGEFEILPYVFTGIIKGKWFKEVPDLFRENGIEMDLSTRGMYAPPVSKPAPTKGERLKIMLTRAWSKLDIAVYKLFHKD